MNLKDARKIVSAFPADHISCDPCNKADLTAAIKASRCPVCSARMASDDDAHDKDVVYYTCERDPMHFYTFYKSDETVIPI